MKAFLKADNCLIYPLKRVEKKKKEGM